MSQQETPSAADQNKGIRWGWIVAGLAVFLMAAMFFMKGMEGSVQYYMTVSEYLEQQDKYDGKKIKLAGKVKAESLKKTGNRYDFIVEDLGKEISVTYEGLAPDTFKDGSEVVVEGRASPLPHFTASGLMAKCASKYEAGGLPPIEQMRSKSIH